MRDFFKTNKNQIFLWSYIIIFAVTVLNWGVVYDGAMNILGLLSPLFYAIGIAFVLNIPMRKIEKGLRKIIKEKNFLHRFIRTFSLLLTLILTVIILYLLCIIIIPRVSSSLALVFKNFGTLMNQTIASIDGIFADLHIDFRLEEIGAVKNLKNISWKEAFDQIIIVLGGLADGVVSNALAFTNTFFQWFLAFCLSLYLLAGKENFISQFRKVTLSFFSVEHSDRIFLIGRKANFIFTKFVGGQLVDCAIKGVMFYITFKIVGFPLPELSAAIITVCSIVPVFGPIFAMVIDFVLIFAFDPMQALWFVILFQILSNLESQIIYPKIVGKSIGLPGIWVLLSIFVLGDIFGLMGMILAVPLTALAYTLFSEFIANRLKKKDIDYIVNLDKGDEIE